MKKKLLWCAGIIVLIGLVVLGVLRYVEVRNRQTDPNWKLAEQIYNMENAVKEVDDVDVPSGVVYDLTGRRVEEPTRPGIYIKDGKAVFVR